MSIYKIEVSGIAVGRAVQAMKKMPDCFIPTGSRVYGGSEMNSDFDFIVNPNATWWGGQVMNGLIESWTIGGEGAPWKHTLVCASESYAPDEDVARDTADMPVKDGFPMVYLIGPFTKINLIFPESEKAFKAWCEATKILSELKGQDAERVLNKEARVLAFRVLRRQIEKGLK
jgi:hypothetical protein